MAKITEAERTVTDLYSLRHLIMPKHDSTYFAMELPQMLEQSYTQILQWANRWRLGIYHSMKQAAITAKGLTIPIWKIWAPDGTEPRKKVDRRIMTSAKPTKYKDIKITNKMRVIAQTEKSKHWKLNWLLCNMINKKIVGAVLHHRYQEDCQHRSVKMKPH